MGGGIREGGPLLSLSLSLSPFPKWASRSSRGLAAAAWLRNGMTMAMGEREAGGAANRITFRK